MKISTSTLQHKLVNWYAIHKRDLPWRSTSDPYKVWISEIILQQTRVAQGMAYYMRFVDRFPRVEDLASANEDEVLLLWQGLGYYSRARNMHFAAKQVINEFQCVFPQRFDELIGLKGVGPYTAAAVSSICSGEAVAVVDGNVERVLSRVFAYAEPVNTAKGKKDMAQFAKEVLNLKAPGDHNQAIMELGALVCTPKKPSCSTCPIQAHCLAYRSDTQHSLPQKLKKTKQKKRYFNYFWLMHDDMVFLQKRLEGDIWQGLYEPYLIESKCSKTDKQLLELVNEVFKNVQKVNISEVEYKHVLSHQILLAKFSEVVLTEAESTKKGQWIPRHQLNEFPVSRLTERFLESR